MNPLFAAAGLIAFGLVYFFRKRHSRISLSNIRGPKSSSFLLGNLLELHRGQAGETDFKWKSCYGDIVRFKGIFGEDHLLVSDPKALQWILNTSARWYEKQQDRRYLSRLTSGKGLGWAQGEDHKRQKRIILPGLSGPEAEAHLPLFRGCAESMTARWTEIVASSIDKKVDLNVLPWLSRSTLDAIGEAAFDIRLNALQDDSHVLVRSYSNLVKDLFGHPSPGQIFFQAVTAHLPIKVLEWLCEYGSIPKIQRIRHMTKVATEVAEELVKEKAATLLQEKGKRDILSLLVQANMAADAKNKLSKEELLAQMRTILFAGHETLSHTLCWTLLELARHPKVQSRLRAEITETQTKIHARGGSEFTIADFDAMPYTTAVMKEVLRYHPVIYHSHRIAGRDDMLPLSQPITTESGEVINKVPVPEGTPIVVSIAAYNRNTEVWGEDAHEFNPDRWLEGVANEKRAVSIGVYANLLTFLCGPRACIGWRFAVIEMQAFLVEVVGKFEFEMTNKAERILREACVIMVPAVEGEGEGGAQLPLAISLACQDDGY
ncbi:cytochrome P450 [Paxillus ammoniavirescens]|nr:cytochrome P450 [Paxillus ammoniavirescens]